jgi:hypothetical protein
MMYDESHQFTEADIKTMHKVWLLESMNGQEAIETSI